MNMYMKNIASHDPYTQNGDNLLWRTQGVELVLEHSDRPVMQVVIGGDTSQHFTGDGTVVLEHTLTNINYNIRALLIG